MSMSTQLESVASSSMSAQATEDPTGQLYNENESDDSDCQERKRANRKHVDRRHDHSEHDESEQEDTSESSEDTDSGYPPIDVHLTLGYPNVDVHAEVSRFQEGVLVIDHERGRRNELLTAVGQAELDNLIETDMVFSFELLDNQARAMEPGWRLRTPGTGSETDQEGQKAAERVYTALLNKFASGLSSGFLKGKCLEDLGTSVSELEARIEEFHSQNEEHA